MIRAIAGSWRSSRWERVGITTTTPVRAALARAFGGGRIDCTYYILTLLSCIGLIWDLKRPPAAVLKNATSAGIAGDRAARNLAESFNADFIAGAIRSASFSSSLAALQQRLGATQLRASEALAGMHVPHLPTRAEILHRALTMYAKTPSLDDIVDRAHALLLEAVGIKLEAALA